MRAHHHMQVPQPGMTWHDLASYEAPHLCLAVLGPTADDVAGLVRGQGSCHISVLHIELNSRLRNHLMWGRQLVTWISGCALHVRRFCFTACNQIACDLS